MENHMLNRAEYREKRINLESRPGFAWFALTGNCNMRCGHCPVIREAEANEEIGNRVYERFCEEVLPFLNQVKLGGNNYGEQLLSKRISGFLDQCSVAGVRSSIHTNGLLLQKNVLAKVVETKTHITVSIEGTDENYKANRHVEWKIIRKNIENLVDARNQKKQNFTIRLAFTAFKDNLADLFALSDLGVDEITVSWVKPKNDEWTEKAYSAKEREELQSKFIPKVREHFKKTGTTITIGNPASRESAEKTAVSCRFPWDSVNVRENGDVLPCCYAGDSLIMGNLKQKSFDQIWNGRRYRSLRKSFVTGKLKSTCRICKGDFKLDKGVSLSDTALKQLKGVLVKYKLYQVLNTLYLIRRKFLA